MINKRFLIVLIICALSFKVHGQIVNLTDAGSNRLLSENKYESILGSPFLEDDWVAGKVIDDRGKKHENLYLKYNAFEDHLQLLKDGTAIILDNNIIKEFEIVIPDGNKIVTKTFRNGFGDVDAKHNRNGFYEVLYSGDYHLLKKHTVNKVKISQTGYNVVEDQVQFVSNELYYFVDPSGKAVKFKLKKKYILELFGDKKKEVTNFAKNKSINFKDETEIAQLVQHYESLEVQ